MNNEQLRALVNRASKLQTEASALHSALLLQYQEDIKPPKPPQLLGLEASDLPPGTEVELVTRPIGWPFGEGSRGVVVRGQHRDDEVMVLFKVAGGEDWARTVLPSLLRLSTPRLAAAPETQPRLNKVGDRVALTQNYWQPTFKAGDKGVVTLVHDILNKHGGKEDRYSVRIDGFKGTIVPGASQLEPAPFKKGDFVYFRKDFGNVQAGTHGVFHSEQVVVCDGGRQMHMGGADLVALAPRRNVRVADLPEGTRVAIQDCGARTYSKGTVCDKVDGSCVYVRFDNKPGSQTSCFAGNLCIID